MQLKAKFKKIIEKCNTITSNKIADLNKHYKTKYNTTFTEVTENKVHPPKEAVNKKTLAQVIKNTVEGESTCEKVSYWWNHTR